MEGLNRIWIGSYIIRAYEPKYERKPLKAEERSMEKEPTSGFRPTTNRNKIWKRRVKEVTYSEALKGKRNTAKGEKQEEVGEFRADYDIHFQSTEVEGKWLKGAYSGYLKKEFTWCEHGEEIQNEGGGNLKILDMGSNMVLIQSTTEKETGEIIEGLDEWVNFWMDWCRPWTYTDVSQNRSVWTRWIGVPLQAWSLRFFCLGSSKMGSLIELHEVTKRKEKLDEAFVQIYTGLKSVDRIISCRIDGACFQVKIEEIKCLDKELHLRRSEEQDSEEESTCMAEGEDWDAASIEAALAKASEFNSDGEETAENGGGILNLTREGEKTETESSNTQIAADNDNGSFRFQSSMGKTTSHDLVGSEAGEGGETVGPGPELNNSLEVLGPEPMKDPESDLGENSLGQRISSPIGGRPHLESVSEEVRTDPRPSGVAKIISDRKRGGEIDWEGEIEK